MHVELLIATSPQEGLRGIILTLSVCVYVCVSGQYFGILFLGYSLKMIFIGQMGHRDGTLLFNVQLYHKNWAIFFHRHLLGYSIRWNNNILSEQRNDVTKNTSIFDFNM